MTPVVAPVPARRRVVVVGTSGSGKTTLAAALAGRLGVPHVELDGLYWGPAWTPVPADQFDDRVAAAVAEPGWVIDGNYSRVRASIWAAADTVVWLDYGLPRVMWQVARRTARRVARREVLWAGNRERVGVQLFTTDSILWWALITWGRRRREYPGLLARAVVGGTTAVRLRTPRQTAAWLAEARPAGGPVPDMSARSGPR